MAAGKVLIGHTEWSDRRVGVLCGLAHDLAFTSTEAGRDFADALSSRMPGRVSW